MYKLIEKENSDDFIVKKFGGMLSLSFEAYVLRWADRIIKDYAGGTWRIAETSMGAPFMVLVSEGEKIGIANPFGGHKFELDYDIASIAVNLYAYNHLLEKNMINDDLPEKVRDRYENLLLEFRDSLFHEGYQYAKERGQEDKLYLMYN